MPAYLNLLEFTGMIIAVDYWESNFLILKTFCLSIWTCNCVRSLWMEMGSLLVAGKKWDGREIIKVIMSKEDNFKKSLCLLSWCRLITFFITQENIVDIWESAKCLMMIRHMMKCSGVWDCFTLEGEIGHVIKHWRSFVSWSRSRCYFYRKADHKLDKQHKY